MIAKRCALALALGLSVTACGGGESGQPSAGQDQIFLAVAEDFRGYHERPSFDVSGEAALIGIHDGSVITEAGRLTERIRRPDFGHLEIEVTVDDPKAYTRPWTVTLRQQFAGDTELIDEICAEGEKFSSKLK